MFFLLSRLCASIFSLSQPKTHLKQALMILTLRRLPKNSIWTSEFHVNFNCETMRGKTFPKIISFRQRMKRELESVIRFDLGEGHRLMTA